MVSTKDILEKYGTKLQKELDSFPTSSEKSSSEYQKFKLEMVPEVSRYERWTQTLGNLLSIKCSEKDRVKLEKYLTTAHVSVTPNQALTLATVSLIGSMFMIIFVSIGIYFLTDTVPLLFAFLGIIASLFVFYYSYTMPQRLANSWRLKASAQMVPAILYIVIYMKHTSNLERAVAFASEHLEGPLALDFKKIFYDVEVGKYSNIKQGLDTYLDSWKEDAPEFVESFHLIESSLYEPSEEQRIRILEKALQVILDGVYEKMLKYSREIRSPLSTLYMLGIVLPVLGLTLLPLASALLQGMIKWYHVLVLFNIIFPFFVFYLISEVLLKRPGGYGETSVLELDPNYDKFKSKQPWKTYLPLLIVFLFIGFLPFIFQINFLTNLLGLKNDYTFSQLGISILGDVKLFDFKEVGNKIVGPFGPLATLLSLFIPLGIALYFSKVYETKTKILISSRNDTKLLEEEFNNSLFLLGNRLADGIPAEIAFAKVAESTKGQKTQSFFAIINQNIQQMGMSVEKAIFDPKRGALSFFPSPLIATSMKILVESVKKGLQVAARSLMSISEYVRNIQKINQRLRDLLAEIVSDMKSNMSFLAPLLAGIVVGLAAMLAAILTKLQLLQDLALSGEAKELSNLGTISTFTSIFKVTEMIPPYFLQIIIGGYIIEIIFILTTALVTVDSGKDPLKEKHDLSVYLKIGVGLYTITALVSILALTLLSSIVLSGITT